MSTTPTTFGTVSRNDHRTCIYGAGIFGPVNQLAHWAGYNGWPCSNLARLDDIAVVFDEAGDLVECTDDDVPADELNAWASECLVRAGYPNHPAIR